MTAQDLGRVERVGDTVHRPVGPWTAAVHGLLHHLEAVGYDRAPRVLGFDEQGREVLTWIGGESGPDGWAKVVADRGLIAFARLLRDYHDAVAVYRPAETTCWSTATADRWAMRWSVMVISVRGTPSGVVRRRSESSTGTTLVRRRACMMLLTRSNT